MVTNLPKEVIESSNHIRDIEAKISSLEGQATKWMNRAIKPVNAEIAEELMQDARIAALQALTLRNALKELKKDHGRIVAELC